MCISCQSVAVLLFLAVDTVAVMDAPRRVGDMSTFLAAVVGSFAGASFPWLLRLLLHGCRVCFCFSVGGRGVNPR